MPVQCTCRQCGTVFFRAPSRVAHGRGKCCSVACSHAYLGKLPPQSCRQCGAEITASPSEIKNGRRKLCGRRCAALARLIPPTEGFWEKVDKNGPVPSHAPHLGPCWVWGGSRAGTGYGSMTRDHKTYLTHRLSYAMANGPIPPRMVVCHRCDNPPCCRPDHLFLGTQADNVADKIAKGRQDVGRGMAKQNARLTDDDVREIRRLADDGVGTWSLARRFGVSPPTIYGVVTGRSWRHVE